ncbi:MAG: Ig-like domain-containing protein, partial [Pirellulales bacterium]
DVWTAWHTNSGDANPANSEVRMRRSVNGGATFQAELANLPFTAGNADVNDNAPPNPRVPGNLSWWLGSPQPRILTHPTIPGTLFVVCVDDPNNIFANGDDSDVVLARSTDYGATWTTSTISHAPVGTFEIMPAAAIDELGNIAVAWYDNRRGLTNAGLDGMPGNGDDDFLLDVYATVSRDGGLTFTNDFRLTDVAFDPDLGATDRFPPNNVLRIGEYFGLAAADGTVFVDWTGNSMAAQQILFDKFNMLGPFADSSESNNTISTATILGSPPAVTLQDRTLNTDDAVDYYKYTAHSTGTLAVSAYFDAGVTDVELQVLDARGNVIASGTESNIAPGLDQDRLVIPVVAAQEYFIKVFPGDPLSNPVVYDLEVENFAAPGPPVVEFDPADDSGLSNLDLVTFESTGAHFFVQADLTDLAAAGVAILTPAEATAGVTPGAAVQLFVNGAAVGFAAVVAGTDNTLFEIDLNADLAKFSVGGPNAAGPLGYPGFSNFITAAVRIFDGQKNAGGAAAPATARGPLSEPLRVIFDDTAPLAPSVPDLLAASDSGLSNSDNITNVNPPAFQGTGEANAMIRLFANGELVGQGVVGSDLTDGVAGNGLGAWEVTIEPLADGIYNITALLEDLAGNIGLASSELAVTVDTAANSRPQRPTLDLVDSDDTGWSDKDNVTRLSTLTFRVSAEPNSMVVIKDGNTVIDAFVMPASPFTFRTIAWPVAGIFAFGPHPLSAESTDDAGNRSDQSEELLVTIDSDVPLAPTAPDLLASSDTGTFDDDDVTNLQPLAFQGTAEQNTRVRILANGVVVGQGIVGTDLTAPPTDPEEPAIIGAWEVTTEPLADGTYTITAEIEDQAGNISTLSGSLTVTVDTVLPDTPYLDLTDSSDTGRHNQDNITSDNTPTVTLTADDVQAAGLNLPPHDIRYRLFDRDGTGPDVLLIDSFVTIPGLTTGNFFTETLSTLADGVHNLKLEVEDRAGNVSHAFLLLVTIDTVAPPVSFGLPATADDGLDPASDSGVIGNQTTFTDRRTNVTTPAFFGTAEANSINRVTADTIGGQILIGLNVAIPLDGNFAFPNGRWALTSSVYLNDPSLFAHDGIRSIRVTAEDVAGNVSQSQLLEIFLDTQGPQVTNVEITDDAGFNLFGLKPGNALQGPTPLVHSLTIRLQDLPAQQVPFFRDAIEAGVAVTQGLFTLVGDHNGVIAISAIVVTNDAPIMGQAATASIELQFAVPLPDDRFTLTIADTLPDVVGNKLDGESNAIQPSGTPQFPSGDRQPGGDFVARFTVDSRAEIGTYAVANVFVDANGNFLADPQGDDDDFTNRDLTFALGIVPALEGVVSPMGIHDSVFAGNFPTTVRDEGESLVADGFDKLAAYGYDPVAGGFRWLVDVNNDGIVDPADGDFATKQPAGFQ